MEKLQLFGSKRDPATYPRANVAPITRTKVTEVALRLNKYS